jgi:hypothetical protein
MNKQQVGRYLLKVSESVGGVDGVKQSSMSVANQQLER